MVVDCVVGIIVKVYFMDFWKDIVYKTHGCSLNGEPGTVFTKPRISMYVVVGRECNTACKFCTFRGTSYNFDYNKFEEIVQGILQGGVLGKVQFTGGEPSLYLDTVDKCSRIIRKYSPDTFISVNTNGTHLRELAGLGVVDNIALSRHAVSWEDNAIIMGVTVDKVATDEEIKAVAIEYPNLLHISCNLIKGYVCDAESLREYLEFASRLGIYDVGFVSLMPVNAYCKEHFVDFKDIDMDSIPCLIQNLEWSQKKGNCEVCRCRNYLYFAENQQIVALYSRFACEHKSVTSYVVYEDNHIKQGFNGSIIY